MMMKMKMKTVHQLKAPSLLISLIILLGAGGVICNEHAPHPAGSAAGHGGHAEHLQHVHGHDSHDVHQQHDGHREGHSLSAEPSEEESF